MGYTTLPQVMRELEERWVNLQDMGRNDQTTNGVKKCRHYHPISTYSKTA
jgi:hypothetical protein